MKSYQETKVFKLSCQAIEQRFGQGNFDDATEYVWDLIYHYFGNSDNFTIKHIDFDDKQDNPYFHTLNIEIEGIDSVTADFVYQALIDKGLTL